MFPFDLIYIVIIMSALVTGIVNMTKRKEKLNLPSPSQPFNETIARSSSAKPKKAPIKQANKSSATREADKPSVSVEVIIDALVDDGENLIKLNEEIDSLIDESLANKIVPTVQDAPLEDEVLEETLSTEQDGKPSIIPVIPSESILSVSDAPYDNISDSSDDSDEDIIIVKPSKNDDGNDSDSDSSDDEIVIPYLESATTRFPSRGQKNQDNTKKINKKADEKKSSNNKSSSFRETITTVKPTNNKPLFSKSTTSKSPTVSSSRVTKASEIVPASITPPIVKLPKLGTQKNNIFGNSSKTEKNFDLDSVTKKMEYLRKCNDEQLSKYIDDDDDDVVSRWYASNKPGIVRDNNNDLSIKEADAGNEINEVILQLDRATDVDVQWSKDNAEFDMSDITADILFGPNECNFNNQTGIDKLKKKVVNKANIVIKCYKNKLNECGEQKKLLVQGLEKANKNVAKYAGKIEILKNKLSEYESQKDGLLKLAEKCESDYLKISELENELAKSKEKNNKFKEALAKCLENKKECRIKVDELITAIEQCKENRKKSLEEISALQEKLDASDDKSQELNDLLSAMKDEIDKLSRKIEYLEDQNNTLQSENGDLKEKLAKTLKTVQVLTAKYRHLKEQYGC